MMNQHYAYIQILNHLVDRDFYRDNVEKFRFVYTGEDVEGVNDDHISSIGEG